MSATLLRIELRRNTVLLLLPVLAALALLSPAWRHLSALALWPGRSIDAQTALQGVDPLFAGGAAWMAGRERRREMGDLLATTPRSPWGRLLTIWAATTLWGVLLYLIIVAVILGVTAQQATWGAPVPWPLLVGLLEMPALAALGCALGSGLPSRFTPPLVGVGVFITIGLGPTLVNHGDKIGLLAPGYPSISFSVWYASSAALGLVQALFLLGLTAVGLGSLGLSRRVPGHLHRAHRAVLVTAIGGALTLASIGLVTTVQARWAGEMPLFGAPVSGTPIPYAPVCRAAPLPVCVHPAYRTQLGETTALINRIAAPLLGVSGAPTRATQQPATVGVISQGTRRVLAFAPIDLHDPTNPPQLVQSWDGQVAVSLVADHHRTAGWRWTTDKAQNAVALYLLRRAAAPFDATQFDQEPDVSAAEHRFAALPARERHAWFSAHYALLRAGRVPLEELP